MFQSKRTIEVFFYKRTILHFIDLCQDGCIPFSAHLLLTLVRDCIPIKRDTPAPT
ncbi:hypothetical protein BDQ17DRAFT_1377377 [Cyathus striatus]|nr:hypothetical protein BDQ17DRAFT_1377377 [Cyathus striatus]